MSENNGSKDSNSNQDHKTSSFRGLTIFELSLILIIVGGSLFWGLTQKAQTRSKLYDQERKLKVGLLAENLKVYVRENESFPATDKFNDKSRRDIAFSQFLSENGAGVMQDPADANKLISYTAEPENCAETTDNPCTKATLSLRLSDGTEYYRFAIKPGTESQYLEEVNSEPDLETTETTVEE